MPVFDWATNSIAQRIAGVDPAVSLSRFAASTNSTWKALGGKIVTGDSGNPAFLLIGSEPILLYCLHTGGVGHGPAIHAHRREIQKAMDELCPGYMLEVFDFSRGKSEKSK